MMTSKRFFARVAIGTTVLLAAVAFPTPATADPVLTMQFGSLDGDWDHTTSIFTAVASDTIGVAGSFGRIDRLFAPTGFARFDDGFFGDTLAHFVLSMDLSSITATTAVVLTGTVTVTDFDGDTMTADLTGLWTDNGSSVEFDGQIFNILFTDIGTQDGDFNGAGPGGANGTLFSMDFGSLVLPFSGAIDSLSFPDGVDFFDTGVSFSNAVTQGGAQIVPAPGAFLLAAMGLAGVGWLKRRVA